MWSGNFQQLRVKGKGVAENDVSLSDPELACLHQIPFMLELPRGCVILWNNCGFLFITGHLWCSLSLAYCSSSSSLTKVDAMFCIFFPTLDSFWASPPPREWGSIPWLHFQVCSSSRRSSFRLLIMIFRRQTGCSFFFSFHWQKMGLAASSRAKS